MKKIIITASLLSFILILVTSCHKEAPDSIDIQKIAGKIHWVEQACFRIDASPYTIYVPGLSWQPGRELYSKQDPWRQAVILILRYFIRSQPTGYYFHLHSN